MTEIRIQSLPQARGCPKCGRKRADTSGISVRLRITDGHAQVIGHHCDQCRQVLAEERGER